MLKFLFVAFFFLFFLFSCDTGDKKFRGKKIDYSKVSVFKTDKAKGFSTIYRGKLIKIDKAIEKLYLWIKKNGRFVAGPPRVTLDKMPNFKKDGIVSAVICFPVSDDRGSGLYKGKNPGIIVRQFNHAPESYLSMIYKGKIDFIEAGFIKVNDWLSDNNFDKPKNIILLFEDTFKSLDKIRKIRILYRFDKQILERIK